MDNLSSWCVLVCINLVYKMLVRLEMYLFRLILTRFAFGLVPALTSVGVDNDPVLVLIHLILILIS